MATIQFTRLGTDKFLTDLKGTIVNFTDVMQAESVVELFSDPYGAVVVADAAELAELAHAAETASDEPQAAPQEQDQTNTKFVAQEDAETGSWGVYDNDKQVWAGKNMSEVQATKLANILNRS